MNGKKPTRNQKKLMEKNNINYFDWLVLSDTPERLIVMNRYTGAVKTIWR